MEPVITFKSLSNTIYFLGFQLFDTVIITLFPVMFGIALSSFSLILLTFIPFYWAGKKIKYRPKDYESSLFRYSRVDKELMVSLYDLPGYKMVLK